ncbi:MAG: DUF456 family protein [Cyanobacteria bacterium P01_D01_bin.73]
MELMLLYWFLVGVMLFGVAGSFLPALPGSSLIVLAMVVWGAVNGFGSVGLPLAVAIVVLLFSLVIDTLGSILGAKQAGASSWGQIGAFVGLALGFFGLLPALPFGGPLIGILVGPVIGAFCGEFAFRLKSRTPIVVGAKRSLKATIGIVLGSVVSSIIQGVLALVAVIVFLASTWSQMGG